MLEKGWMNIDENTHDDGTTHTHDDGTTHTHDDGTTHSHGGNEHAEDQFNAKKEMLLKQLLTSEARLRLNNWLKIIY